MLSLQNIDISLHSISLEEAMRVDLNARYDLKVLLPRTTAIRLLQSENPEILVQKNSENFFQHYKNNYFDTPDLSFYKAHGLGKPKRLKIRKRNYADTDSSFVEIKMKEVSKTIKRRSSTIFSDQLSEEDLSFIKRYYLGAENLVPSLSIEYDRMVIWKKDLSGRITMDFNYRPLFGEVSTCFDRAVILEMKGSYLFLNWALRVFGVPIARHITPFSKYCIGLEETIRSAKHPLKFFRPIHQQLLKLNN